LKSTHGNVHGRTCFLSLKNGEIEENKESTFRDDFGGLEASSCDSTADIPLEMINCIEISSPPSTNTKTSIIQDQPSSCQKDLLQDDREVKKLSN